MHARNAEIIRSQLRPEKAHRIRSTGLLLFLMTLLLCGAGWLLLRSMNRSNNDSASGHDEAPLQPSAISTAIEVPQKNEAETNPSEALPIAQTLGGGEAIDVSADDEAPDPKAQGAAPVRAVRSKRTGMQTSVREKPSSGLQANAEPSYLSITTPGGWGSVFVDR
ncbi:MAG: hypothetical protein R3A47_06845 [Polyangiales bacterium]